MVQNTGEINTADVAAGEEQLDARLAELLRLMYRQHLDHQEVQPVSS
ncbi:MAG TPA: hypothetical protein VF070_14350 [Streptosporangiaceae bacterium]